MRRKHVEVTEGSGFDVEGYAVGRLAELVAEGTISNMAASPGKLAELCPAAVAAVRGTLATNGLIDAIIWLEGWQDPVRLFEDELMIRTRAGGGCGGSDQSAGCTNLRCTNLRRQGRQRAAEVGHR